MASCSPGVYEISCSRLYISWATSGVTISAVTVRRITVWTGSRSIRYPVISAPPGSHERRDCHQNFRQVFACLLSLATRSWPFGPISYQERTSTLSLSRAHSPQTQPNPAQTKIPHHDPRKIRSELGPRQTLLMTLTPVADGVVSPQTIPIDCAGPSSSVSADGRMRTRSPKETG